MSRRGADVPSAWLMMIPFASSYWFWRWCVGVGKVFRTGRCAAALLAAFVAFPGAHAQLSNPGFESGLSGWTVVDQNTGSWFSKISGSSLLSRLSLPTAPEGSYAAITDQTGPGSHVLYQDFVVTSQTISLSFQYLIANSTNVFSNAATLDSLFSPNQQVRVDIIRISADVFSINSQDVMINLFQANTNQPSFVDFQATWDSTNYIGQTFRMRFAEVDNQGFFNFGIDNVGLSGGVAAVPEPASSAVLGSFAALVVAVWIKRRRRGAGGHFSKAGQA